MTVFKKAESLTAFLSQQSHNGKKVGFVPTMGALHEGHLSLLQQAKAETDITVCSIFVNPTQFNNAADFDKYPVTVERDIELLIATGCDVLFLPSKEEIYPAGYTARHYDLGSLETMLEGRYRPGHFQGVCQVVDRLLSIVNPERLFLGQKDYQQCQVIQRLLTITGRTGIYLRIAPTIRENDGLAMSSRNMRLTPGQREKAAALFAALSRSKQDFHTQPVEKIKAAAVEHLTGKGFKVDYFEIADASTLLPVSAPVGEAFALVAAYLDDIRLIDNLPLN